MEFTGLLKGILKGPYSTASYHFTLH